MKTPKEKLKEIYDEYLSWKENNKGKHFYQYLASNKYTLAFTVLKIQKNLTEECGFSTTSECRKAINELEKQETWQDILKEFEKTIVDSEFMYSSLRQFLVKNFEVPKRK